MRKWTTSDSKTREFTFVLFPMFSNHCLANAVEPLRAANELLMQDEYSWRFVTLDGEVVESSSGLPILPNGRLSDHPGSDCLFVVSSYNVKNHAHSGTRRALRAAAKRFDAMAGMDTGSWLMADAGLLDNQRATIHLRDLVAFSETFDRVEALAERYVFDGARMTCGGAMTAFDLMLEILRRAHGEALKLEVSAFFLQQASQADLLPFQRDVASSAVANTIATMEDNIEDPLPVSALAAAQNMSQRTLTRLFQRELGATPLQVYKRLRLAVARDYAQRSHYSMLEIAIRCGYRDASAMTRAFVQEYGRTPSMLRHINSSG